MRIPWFVWAGTLTMVSPLIRSALLPHFQRARYSDKTIIITGPLGILGKTMTYELALKECRLILACRDIDHCKIFRRELVLKTKNKNIACRYLDLEDVESMDRFIAQIVKEEPRLDVLINNAAIKHCEKKEITKYGVEKMYLVNFLAPFYLSLRLHDKLLESGKLTGDSRIVNNLGTIKKSWKLDIDDINFEKRKWSSDNAYKQSKLALAYFTILMDKFSQDKYHDLYVFGTNPIANKVLNAMVEPKTFLQYLKGLSECFIKYDSSSSVQSMIMCALDPGFARRDKSGRLYSYFLGSWGWPKNCLRENDAKLVWNHAIDLINNNLHPKNKSTSGSLAPALNDVANNVIQTTQPIITPE